MVPAFQNLPKTSFIMILPFEKHIWNCKSIMNSKFGNFLNDTSSTALTGMVNKKNYITFTQHITSVENCLDWIQLAQNRDGWWTLVSMVKNFWVP
jgi:hypothetical protein